MKESPAEHAQAPPDHDTVMVLRVQHGPDASWQLYFPSSGQRLHFTSVAALLTYLTATLESQLPSPLTPSPIQS